MAGYAKLFSSITESSLWCVSSKDARLLFVSMLARADASGVVEASLPGLAKIANLSLKETEAALAELSSPDVYDRSGRDEGRRIVKVDGGWALVNFAVYRERRNEDERREYMRTYMQKYRETSVNNCKPRKPMLAEAEAEAEASNISLSLPTLSLPTLSTQKSAKNEERVEPDQEPEKDADQPYWKAWKNGFPNASPLQQHDRINLVKLQDLYNAHGATIFTAAARAFKADCDAGRIRVKTIGTFVAVAEKNYIPKAKTPVDKQAQMVASGKDTLVQRLNSVGTSLFWKCEDRDLFLAKWYAFLKQRNALPPGIPDPP